MQVKDQFLDHEFYISALEHVMTNKIKQLCSFGIQMQYVSDSAQLLSLVTTLVMMFGRLRWIQQTTRHPTSEKPPVMCVCVWSRGTRYFEIFLHLPQYNLSRPITQLWYRVRKLILNMYVHLILIYKFFKYRHT